MAFIFRYAGGNTYNPQPTPDWQKDITTFFQAVPRPVCEGSSQPESGEASGSNTGGTSVSGDTSSNNEEKHVTASPAKGEGSSGFVKNGMISDDDD